MASINIDSMINQVLQGQGVPANGPIMPGTWAYYDELEKINFDQQEALRLLEQSGVTFDEEEEHYVSGDGLEIALTLVYPDTSKHKALAEIIQTGWESIGIEVTLQAKPYEQVLSDLENRAYETALVDINFTRSPDPDPYPFWGQAQIQSGQNFAEWNNRSASEFLEQARMTVDFGERERLYRNFQVLFMREMPSLPLFYSTFTYAISTDVQGVSLGPIFEPSDRLNDAANWYILTSRETSITPTIDNQIETEE